jgi:hypothetical protein
MALKAGPKGAIPTTRGWVHPTTGELLKSQRITQEQLDEYNGVQMIAEPAPIIEPEPEPEEELILDEVVVEAPKPKKKKKRSLFG